MSSFNSYFNNTADLKSAISADFHSQREKEYSLVVFEKRPSKAKIWEKLGPVIRKNDKLAVTFMQKLENGKENLLMSLVGCLNCQHLYMYHSSQGTSSLINHKCMFSAVGCSTIMKSHFKQKNKTSHFQSHHPPIKLISTLRAFAVSAVRISE